MAFSGRPPHYDHLQYALQWTNLENATKDQVLGDYFSHVHLSNRLLDSNTCCTSEYFLNYLQGWKQGIEQLWEEVREKI